MKKNITNEEQMAVAILAEWLAATFVKNKLEGKSHAIGWQLLENMIYGSLGASKSGAVWMTTLSSLTSLNCTTGAANISGSLTSARFDATDFVKWIIEEIEESIIRTRILLKTNKQRHLYLKRQAEPGSVFDILSMAIPGEESRLEELKKKIPEEWAGMYQGGDSALQAQ